MKISSACAIASTAAPQTLASASRNSALLQVGGTTTGSNANDDPLQCASTLRRHSDARSGRSTLADVRMPLALSSWKIRPNGIGTTAWHTLQLDQFNEPCNLR